MDKRDFLKYSLLAGVSTLALPKNLFAQSPDFSDYKAIVVVFQGGGSDGLNTFIPYSSDAKTGYSNYASIRDVLRVENNELALNTNAGELSLSKGAGNPYYKNNSIGDAYLNGLYSHTLNGAKLPYATNGVMPELAHIINEGNGAIIANVGNLIAPATKSELLGQKKPLPPFLYAHNHQTKLTLCGEASDLNANGWAGRLFDTWDNLAASSIYGMNISFSGATHLFYGAKTEGLKLSPWGPTKYYYTPNWNDTLNAQKRGVATAMYKLERRDVFQKLYTTMKQHSYSMEETLVSDWENSKDIFDGVNNAYGDALFSVLSDSDLGESSKNAIPAEAELKKFEAVAKMIHIGKNIHNLKRQIFYVELGGYDTHANQKFQHAKILRAMSLALGDFQRALKHMGVENEVVTLNVSDFGRSTGNNGDGTDHAWGTNSFVIGDAIKGGVYGTLPDLTLGSDDDLTKKGRLIPTTSTTQLYATVLKWFGVDDTTMNVVLPELKNFSNKDLGFL